MRGWKLFPLLLLLVGLVLACDPVPVPPTGETSATPRGKEAAAADGSEDPAESNREQVDGETAAHAPSTGEGGVGDGATDAGVRPEDDAATVSLGEGFLVWESNRSGRWRLWRRDLDGGPPRRLTPHQKGRQHYAPHISPDGRYVAYLSARDGGRKYPDRGVAGRLELIPAAGGEPRVLVEGARTYFENRSVVWRSPTELVFIGDDFVTRTLDIESGRASRLTAQPSSELGWLVDATLQHATTNAPTFSLFDAEGRRVLERAKLGGCQPYFSHDGRWGVWTAGAGGPLRKFDLETRQASELLAKNDSRLPDGLGYMYFPMPSRDGSLLAFAASRNEHDHFKSDYEVFVVETDPETFELVGEPLRYTEDPATDRYPDVYRSPLALGRQRGEAPLGLAFEAPGEGSWEWSFGDGGRASSDRGQAVDHRYERAGRYSVEARGENGVTHRGLVVVDPARPPRVVQTRLSGDALAVVLRFDEPVRIDAARISLESGSSIRDRRLEEGGRELVIDLVEPLSGADRLVLTGIEDSAPEPNRMPETVLDVGPPLWPASREGLVFAWGTGDAPNLVADAVGEARGISLRPSGVARLDHHWRMMPAAGRFDADSEDAARVKTALQSANEMTLEVTIQPPSEGTRANVVLFSDGRQQNFRLELRGRRLVFHLRTGGRGREGNPQVELFEVPSDRSSHVVVSYTPGRLRAYLDGALRLDAGPDRIRGDFFHWRNLPLGFGPGAAGDLRLEGVAIYDRELSDIEVGAQYERSRRQIDARMPVPPDLLEARLITRTPAPTLEQISPYREALVTYEYEVAAEAAARLGGERIRVAHWSMLDGTRLGVNDRVEGETYGLRLEPFAANSQLASLYLGQSNEIANDLPLFFDPVATD